jgi:hypothetical protein
VVVHNLDATITTPGTVAKRASMQSTSARSMVPASWIVVGSAPGRLIPQRAPSPMGHTAQMRVATPPKAHHTRRGVAGDAVGMT